MKMNVLAVSGSLRSKSSNSALMKAAIRLATEGMEFTVYEGLVDLPHFNPDHDTDGQEPHPAVKSWREQLKEADGVLICTPEYANGVPGSLKNALDWIVSSGEFMNKPVAVISASPTPMGGDRAHASLLLTLNMMNAVIAEGAALTVPFISKKISATGEIADADLERALTALNEALAEAIRANNG
ncbi:NADPH-dependent FMN reductase [Paenibacillus hamazuiensis]|uniref:NADPH-dependent FMN reductase n=1 Tax=Paenibacillus hamazuiensis TaxID=2936508 RepID=UPI00200EE7DB|nr:NADPH-dependent FMN reductase [Paenibacillus hamazuiensis]